MKCFCFFFTAGYFLIDVQIRLWLSKSNYSFKRKYAYIMLFSYQIVLCVIKLHIWVVLIMKRSMFNKFQRRKCKFIKKRELIISVSYKIHRECCIGFFFKNKRGHGVKQTQNVNLPFNRRWKPFKYDIWPITWKKGLQQCIKNINVKLMYQVSDLKKKYFAKQAWQDLYPDCKSSITNISASKIEKSKLRKQRKKRVVHIYVELPTWIIYLLIKSIWTSHHTQRLEYDSNSIKL